jgi:FtsP/CotA-like multicopper oxidase with cupredoxin domain
VQFVYGSCSQPKEHISFTIIGADSSLFNEGLYNENKFVLGPAERLELLIKFAENKG